MTRISPSHTVVDFGIPGIGSYVWHVAENRLEWSEELLFLYGISEPPAGDSGFAALVHPDDRVRVEAETSAFLAGGDRFVHEFRILRPDGSVRRVHDRGVIERARDGRVLRIRGVNVDVTASQARISPLTQTPRADAVARNEKRLRLAQEAGGVASWEYDIGSGEVTWSASARHLFQVEPGWQPSYAGFLDLVHPEDRARVRAAIEEAVAQNAPLDHVFRIMTPSGVRWLESRARIVREDATGRSCLMGVDIDVTAEHERAEAQRAAEERLRAILDTMPPAVWSARSDGTRDYFNRRWYEMTGLPENAGADGWEQALHPDDRASVAAASRESLATGASLEIEARIRHADGTYRWHMCRARPVHAADGAVERWYGTCTDIDARRRLEERLRLGEARLQLALDASNAVGTWDWDLVADVFEVDARFARLLGLPEDFTGAAAPKSAFFEAILPEDLAGAQADVAAAVEYGGAFATTYRVRIAGGGVRWISSRGVCIKDESGAPLRFVGVVIDVTQMKAAEEARALLAHELAHRIKNVFGLLGAIASMSARGRGTELEAYASDLRGRFRSLSTALIYAQPGISQLARDRRPVTILALARALLAPFEPGEAGRIAIGGADAPATDDETTGLALLLHELATNAVKYGALARETGRVVLDGREEEGAYVLTWREEGGPVVDAAPARTGFGLQMIERTIATQLKGSVALDWRPEGLVATLRLAETGCAQGARD